MNKLSTVTACLLICLGIFSCKKTKETVIDENRWPVIRSYDSEHLYNIALPLGGIGTGTVSLGGRGELRDWEIMNRPAKGFSTTGNEMNAPFFSIFVSTPGNEPVTKALMGPLYKWENSGWSWSSTTVKSVPVAQPRTRDISANSGERSPAC